MLHLSSTSSSKPVAPGLVRAALGPVRRTWSLAPRLIRILVAGLVALPFASRPLATWGGNLPAGAQPLADATAWWDHEMDRAGLTAPYDLVHRTVRSWVAASF